MTDRPDQDVPEETAFDDIEEELQGSSREASMSYLPAPRPALGALGSGRPPFRPPR